MESQLEHENERKKYFEKLKQELPDMMLLELGIGGTVYRDGVLSGKMKRLIALGIALRVGCTNCILGHTMGALEAGVTKDEILEAISVVITMSGTTGIGESLKVLKLLDELGKI